MVETIQNGSGPEGQTTPDRTLAELETIVEKGLSAYQEVGNALDEIKSRGLFKETHETFEGYLKEKWNMSLSYGYRLIDAAKFAANSPMGEKPATEREARKMIRESRAKQSKPKVPATNATEKSEPQKPLASGPDWQQIPPSEVVHVDLNPETEVARIKNLIGEDGKWQIEFSKEDWLNSVTQIYDYCNQILIDNDWTEQILIAQAEAILDAQEAQAEMEVTA